MAEAQLYHGSILYADDYKNFIGVKLFIFMEGW